MLRDIAMAFCFGSAPEIAAFIRTDALNFSRAARYYRNAFSLLRFCASAFLLR
jgi:hypothetical protein